MALEMSDDVACEWFGSDGSKTIGRKQIVTSANADVRDADGEGS